MVLKILVISTEGIGDGILIFPFVYNLRKLYASSEIYLLTTNNNLILYKNLKLNGYFLNSTLHKARLPKFDLVFNLNTGYVAGHAKIFTDVLVNYENIITAISHRIMLHVCRNIKNMKEEYLDFLRAVGVHDVEQDYELIYSYLPVAEYKLSDVDYGILAISKLEYKFGEEGYLYLLRRLLQKFPKTPIYIIGQIPEENLCAQLITDKIKAEQVRNIAGKTSLPELIFLIKNCSFLVSFDSLGVHIADIFHRRIFAFYQRYWNYKSYLPSLSDGQEIITFDDISELRASIQNL